LEPMDIVPITTSSQWAVNSKNTNLGIVNLPVRITKIVDDPKSGLEITAEDYQYGAHQPVIYNKGISAGDTVVNAYAQPDNSEVVMFEATSRLTQFQGNQIWIGAAGISSNWGSCNVWVSQDQTKYLPVGSITNPSRMGTLASALAIGTDPDTTDSMVVSLVDNSAPLEAGTTLDADSSNTICYVGGEIISYSACALTGASQYTMGSYLRRGQMGSARAAHAAGALFMRLDSTVLKYTYDPTWAGKTLYFKFQSVNNFGNCPQDLSTLTAVAFTVPGANPGTVSASTGLVSQGSLIGNGTSTILNNQGSMIPTQPLTTLPTYTVTSSTIVFNIAAQSLLRADGSTFNVIAGSQTFTGLSASTAYYLYPYINASTGVLAFANPSTLSTSASALYALQANADGRIQLQVNSAGTQYLSTASSGAPTGGGGGAGGCPEGQELVEEQSRGIIKAIDVEVGDLLKGKVFATGEDIFRMVVQKSTQQAAIWRMVDGHRVSPCEPLWHEGMWKPAFQATGSTIAYGNGTRVNLSLETDDYNEQNFYLVDGTSLLIHNTSKISVS